MNLNLDSVFEDDNIEQAIAYIEDKCGSTGSDKIPSSELRQYWENNKNSIMDSIYSGTYDPGVVIQYDFLSKKAKKRSVSILNNVDKMIARAVSQKVMPQIDNYLSSKCYGYRRGLGTKQLVEYAVKCIEENNTWIAEIDIQHYFDSISHEILIRAIESVIEDDKLRLLLIRFISCRIENENGVYRLAKGLLQGSPLSPVLSNIFLMDFDKEMESKYTCYCR